MTDPLKQLAIGELWSSAADGFVLVDAGGVITATNPTLDQLFGYPEGELVGRPIECLIPESSTDVHHGHRENYQRAPTKRSMGDGRFLRGRRRDGTTFPTLISLAPVSIAERSCTLAAVRDVSDRVQIEAQLAEANELKAIAEDHDRIARDLHDTVIQQLFAVGLSLQGVQGRAQPTAVAERIALAVDDIDDIIRSIRLTIYELHLGRDDRTLAARVEALVRELEPLLGFTPAVHYRGDGADDLAPTVVEDLIPVLREALTNVARHANASAAEVLVTIDDRVTLEVTDDGDGIGEPSRRSGLANLAERAARRGGEFVTRGRDGGGTVLRWAIPVPNPEVDQS